MPRMAPAIAWDIEWDETVGSVEVPLINKNQKGIGIAGRAPCN